ncbi:hypothetical protein J6590_040678 [Homalodisca vitripennis]|nr:hypothetical protein J6590_040678 [Homalodisca vitripennis]
MDTPHPNGSPTNNPYLNLGTNEFKGDFSTTTNDQSNKLLARTGSLSGHPSKQQPRSMLLDLVSLPQPPYPLHCAIGKDKRGYKGLIVARAPA